MGVYVHELSKFLDECVFVVEEYFVLNALHEVQDYESVVLLRLMGVVEEYVVDEELQYGVYFDVVLQFHVHNGVRALPQH